MEQKIWLKLEKEKFSLHSISSYIEKNKIIDIKEIKIAFFLKKFKTKYFLTIFKFSDLFFIEPNKNIYSSWCFTKLSHLLRFGKVLLHIFWPLIFS